MDAELHDVPLCVDLDGTLINTDSLWECLLRLLLKRPWLIFIFLYVLLRHGRVGLKKKLSDYGRNQSWIPAYSQQVIAFLNKAKEKQATIYLTTAAHFDIAKKIANDIGIFQQVVATSNTNLKGKEKSKVLVEKFGAKRFDYIGNAKSDIVVWKNARHAYGANISKRLRKRCIKDISGLKIINMRSENYLKALFRAIRPHQFSKNLLLLIPLISGHLFFSVSNIFQVIIAFLAFSSTAASVYLLNDLIDLDCDRLHQHKRYRPLALGSLPLWLGIVLSPCFLILAFFLAILFLPIQFTIVLSIYYTLTILYSFLLKKFALLDVITLSILYTIRIVAGIFVIHASYSSWLFAYSIFLFFSLAIAKRYSELKSLELTQESQLTDKDYSINDIPMLRQFGAASGLISVMVLTFYVNSQDIAVLYHHHLFLWGTVPIMLYWISRLWILAERNLLNEDPILFAIKDSTTWTLGLITLALFLISW